MKKVITLSVLSMIGLFPIFGNQSFGQTTTISGKVYDSQTNDPLVGVNILVKGTVLGTISNASGSFNLNVSQAPPLTIQISIVGYISQELEITDSQMEGLEIGMEEQTILGQEIVVSASRVEESILESPVSVERLDIRAIRESASPSFYDQIKTLKGIDVSTQSMTFTSINPRGFGANGNTRTVQLIDGIDNQAPGLNFPVGNIVGINDLDLESVEILPGAASALYGPNAIQGIILMNSKSPFEYQGLSVSAKVGLNHVDEEDDDMSIYNDYSLRYAKAFNNKFAFKITGSFLRASDWRGVDYRDQSDIVERSPENIDPNNRSSRTYDGVNVYGDPLLNVGILGQGSAAAALLPTNASGNFTPTGYTESEFVDNTTESIKLGTALHYRINDQIEAFGQFNYGRGSTVYTANDRFVLDDFVIWTAKLELRGSNFFLRGYTTQENSGDTFAANTLASLINVQTTIPTYVGAFGAARLGGASVDAAHDAARIASDGLRAQNLANGRYQQLYDSLRAVPISRGGAKFLDRTDLFHYEGMYNFSNEIDFAEIIVGANYRKYALESEGTLFALQDNGDEFDINEWGAYAQIIKRLLDERLDVTASIRYDKNEFFDGQFSPRISGVYSAGENRNHNIRGSFQRGFRIPTTQDQFIDLDVVTRRLVGSNRSLVDRFQFETNPVYLTSSVATAQQSGNTGDLELVTFEDFKTEKVNTFEVGYKGLIQNKLLIDAYYYFSTFKDFITEIDFTQAPAGSSQGDIVNGSVALQRYGFDVNYDGDVQSQGWALGAEYSLPKGYVVGGNIAYNELIDQEELLAQGLNTFFNTPEYRYNIKLSNRKVTDKLGFNLVYRWQDAFIWESSFGEGVVPAFGTVDAQVSYRVPSIKSVIKLGGSNIFNERYTTSFGNPRIGGLYYISLTFDEFFN
ncbi:TonB-dependent receptor [Fulvivirgaceae bacterium BMA12]|uniref:TonB-dependent receptor n=1 Tax=Agaribacillus aureus TaxID=3051825 RepID=A0ABT8L8Z7_9BACT|nr:TonB-dependent receptor [Fulvivirgaceae bacterium BMA12]